MVFTRPAVGVMAGLEPAQPAEEGPCLEEGPGR